MVHSQNTDPEKKRPLSMAIIRTARSAHRAALMALALAAGLGWHAPAFAQTKIAALVNGTPILSSEVSERQGFIRLTQRKSISSRQALDTLVDEQLLLQEAKRRGLTISEADVDERYNAIATNMKLSTVQLGQALSQGGASARTFKSNIRNQLIQRKLLPALVKAKSTVSEQEIAAAMMERKQKGESRSYRFVLQQMVFVVPAGSSPAYAAQRKNEAEAFRKRVNSCDAAVSGARGMRDVAAKPQVIRLSAQLSSAMRDQMAGMSPGQTMPVQQSESGMEFVVLCDKKEAPDDTAMRQEIQNELTGKATEDEGDKLLADLKKKALIQYR
jgi:peptidyl-prolyl cis-trans isomerase SurA